MVSELFPRIFRDRHRQESLRCPQKTPGGGLSDGRAKRRNVSARRLSRAESGSPGPVVSVGVWAGSRRSADSEITRCGACRCLLDSDFEVVFAPLLDFDGLAPL